MPYLYRKIWPRRGGALAQERALWLSWHDMDMSWLKDGKGKKICQIPIHNSTLVIILTNFHLFLERCAPLNLAISICLYLPRKKFQSVLETLGMFQLYFANSENSLSACFLYFMSCQIYHFIHFFGIFYHFRVIINFGDK